MSIFSLTIKQKVTLGFGAIGVLLIAGSLFFYQSLTQIHTANSNIETLAIPVQKQSNALQLKLLQMAKLETLAFTLSGNEQINQSQRQFNQLHQDYLKAASELANRVNDQATMLATLNQAQTQYQAYQQQSQAMFSAKLAIVTAKQDYAAELARFNQARDNASNAMIDLETVDAPNDAQLLEEVVGTGTRIDDMLYTLGNTMKELARSSSSEEVATHKQDVSFLLSNITTNVNYLKQQAAPLDSGALLDEFDQQWALVQQMLAEPASLYQAQQKVVTQTELAASQHQEANRYFEANYLNLDKLVALADQRFSSLQQAANDEIGAAQTLAIILAIVFLLMASFISFITSKAMLGPLAAVNRALSRIASGDLSQRIEKRSDDEFGTLIDSINTLSDELTTLLRAISRDAHLLDDSAQRSGMQGQRISSSAANQIERVDSAKKLAEHIFVSSSQVNDEASQSAAQIASASERGLEVSQIAASNRERIERLSRRLSEAVDIMARLSQHSNGIGSILTTISGIAEQTNLLALNAAIEAARAGENGRGFAVVADEVRSLASRTQASTAEIQTMIGSLQKETQEAVNTIGQGQTQASDCVAQSQALHDAIAQIDSALNILQQMSQSITHAASQQLEFSQHIETTMTDASTAANTNADEALDMAKRSDEVTTLAHSLTRSVERFKL